jgi:hypothetical protein
MTATTTMHLKVQRSRVSRHALAALTGLLPAAWRAAPKSRPSTAAREAAAVREMACAYAKTDPGFADDLYAAANRHEELYATR